MENKGHKKEIEKQGWNEQNEWEHLGLDLQLAPFARFATEQTTDCLL